MAARFGHQRLVGALIEARADPNFMAINGSRSTPLAEAQAHARLEAAKVLKEHGAKITIAARQRAQEALETSRKAKRDAAPHRIRFGLPVLDAVELPLLFLLLREWKHRGLEARQRRQAEEAQKARKRIEQRRLHSHTPPTRHIAIDLA